MCVPCASASSAMEDLDESDAALDQATRGQALLAKRASLRPIYSVQRARLVGLLIQLKGLRHGRLHLEGKLIGLNSCAEAGVFGVVDTGEIVQPPQQAQVSLLLLASC